MDGKVVVVDEEVEGNRAIPGDLRTARVVKDIANSICETINMTTSPAGCLCWTCRSGWPLTTP